MTSTGHNSDENNSGRKSHRPVEKSDKPSNAHGPSLLPEPLVNTQQLSSQLQYTPLEQDVPQDRSDRERLAGSLHTISSEATINGRLMLSYGRLMYMIMRLASVAVVMAFL